MAEAPVAASLVVSSAQNQRLVDPSRSESQISSLLYDISLRTQEAMENMLKMISEADQSSVEIVEEIEKCKGCALEKKKMLEGDKERFQKAAVRVLEMLNVGDPC